MAARPRYLLRLGLVLLLVALGSGGCAPDRGLFAPQSEPVTLRLAYRQQTVQLQPLLDEFHEKYPSITIETVEVERWGQQFEAHLQSGNIDVFIDDRGALEYAERGMLKPLDDVQLGDFAGIRDDYFKGTWEGLSISGQQWGIPAGLDVLVMYINTDYAQAMKAKIPVPGWSLMDFTELVLAMNNPEGQVEGAEGNKFAFCTTPTEIDPIIFVYLHGGRIVDDLYNPTEVTLNDPRTIEAVQWYADLYNFHGVAPDPEVIRTTFPRGGIYEAAMRGACGVWMGWYSGRGGRDTPREWSVKWKMLPMPRDAAPFDLADEAGYYITKDCQNPKEALKLIRYLSDRWEASGQRMPPRKSLLNDKAYQRGVGQEVAAVITTFSDQLVMLPVDVSGGLEQVGGAMLQAVAKIIDENLNAAQVLDEVQDQVKTAFENP